jgi:hypothetical protein
MAEIALSIFLLPRRSSLKYHLEREYHLGFGYFGVCEYRSGHCAVFQLIVR